MRCRIVLFLSLVFFASNISWANSLRHVKRVVDGDTVVLDGGERVRLIGIDTPESVHPKKPKQCYGQEASDYLRKRIQDKYVRLEYDSEHKDKYDRTLAYIYKGNRLINAEMIKKGYAFAYKRFPFKYLQSFTRYENIAKKKNEGLWNKCIAKKSL